MNDLLPQIDIHKVIGSGTFGVVLEAEYRHTHKKCALKRIHKIGTQMSRQVEILQKIKNAQNIIHMEHIFYTKDDSGQNLFQNIIFQYVQSNLQNLIQSSIRSRTAISQNCIKRYSYQLLNGLSQIHSLNVTHRDLKPQNILLSSQGIIKICDFGSSKILSVQGQNTPYIVSRYYRAPQLIFCITKYTSAIDIWAAACIIAELYLLTPLFKGKSQGQQIFAIAQKLGRMNQHEIKYFKKLVQFEPTIWKYFDKFQKQSFNKDFQMSNESDNLIDLLENMLKYNPQERITAKQALKHSYFDQVRTQFGKPRK